MPVEGAFAEGAPVEAQSTRFRTHPQVHLHGARVTGVGVAGIADIVPVIIFLTGIGMGRAVVNIIGNASPMSRRSLASRIAGG